MILSCLRIQHGYMAAHNSTQTPNAQTNKWRSVVCCKTDAYSLPSRPLCLKQMARDRNPFVSVTSGCAGTAPGSALLTMPQVQMPQSGGTNSTHLGGESRDDFTKVTNIFTHCPVICSSTTKYAESDFTDIYARPRTGIGHKAPGSRRGDERRIVVERGRSEEPLVQY